MSEKVTERERSLTAENLALSEAVYRVMHFLRSSHEKGRLDEKGIAAITRSVDDMISLEYTRSTLRQIRYDLLMNHAVKLQVGAVSELGTGDEYGRGYRQASMDVAHELMRAAHDVFK
jgi:hypothetical protein